MPFDMAKNSPATSRNLFRGTTTNDTADTFSSVVVNTQTVTPYIYSWSTSVDPTPRAEHEAVFFSNALYFFGGTVFTMAKYIPVPDPPDYSNELWKYDLTANSWSLVISPSTPVGRSGAAFFLHGTTAYLLFGLGEISNALTIFDQLYSYNFTTNTWTLVNTTGDPALANLKPDARFRFGSKLVGNLLYVCGGCRTTSFLEANDLWTLNMTTFQWTRLSADNRLRRNAFGFEELGGDLYIFGGESNSGAPTTTGIVSDVLRYRISNGQYSTRVAHSATFDPALTPGPTKLHKFFKLGTGGYANEVPSLLSFGGVSSANVNHGKVRLYRFRIAGSQWALVSDLVIPYSKLDMNSLNGCAVYASGLATNYSGNPTTQTAFTYDVYVDDGYSADVGANFHTGLWKITIGYDSVTTLWSVILVTRMPGKGIFLANQAPNQFTVNNITVELGTNPLGTSLKYTTVLASRNASVETLLIRP